MKFSRTRNWLFANCIILVAVALAFSFKSPVKSGDDETKEAIKEKLVALEKKSWEAWKNRDSAFFKEFLSDDHIEVGAGGVSGKRGVVRSVGSPACSVNSYSVEKFNMVLLDKDVAVLTYHAMQETMCGGNAVPSPAWVSSVYMRRNNVWLNVLYQQSANPK